MTDMLPTIVRLISEPTTIKDDFSPSFSSDTDITVMECFPTYKIKTEMVPIQSNATRTSTSSSKNRPEIPRKSSARASRSFSISSMFTHRNDPIDLGEVKGFERRTSLVLVKDKNDNRKKKADRDERFQNRSNSLPLKLRRGMDIHPNLVLQPAPPTIKFDLIESSSESQNSDRKFRRESGIPFIDDLDMGKDFFIEVTNLADKRLSDGFTLPHQMDLPSPLNHVDPRLEKELDDLGRFCLQSPNPKSNGNDNKKFDIDLANKRFGSFFGSLEVVSLDEMKRMEQEVGTVPKCLRKVSQAGLNDKILKDDEITMEEGVPNLTRKYITQKQLLKHVTVMDVSIPNPALSPIVPSKFSPTSPLPNLDFRNLTYLDPNTILSASIDNLKLNTDLFSHNQLSPMPLFDLANKFELDQTDPVDNRSVLSYYVNYDDNTDWRCGPISYSLPSSSLEQLGQLDHSSDLPVTFPPFSYEVPNLSESEHLDSDQSTTSSASSSHHEGCNNIFHASSHNNLSVSSLPSEMVSDTSSELDDLLSQNPVHKLPLTRNLTHDPASRQSANWRESVLEKELELTMQHLQGTPNLAQLPDRFKFQQATDLNQMNSEDSFSLDYTPDPKAQKQGSITDKENRKSRRRSSLARLSTLSKMLLTKVGL